MRQSPGRHSRTPGRKEEEGQCAKRGCSEPSMVPKALIFCMCLTGCLSSQGTREGRAQPTVAGSGRRVCRRGGGGARGRAASPSVHTASPGSPGPGGRRARCGAHLLRGEREPEPAAPQPRGEAEPVPRPPADPEPRPVSPVFRFRRVRALFRAPRGRAHAALLGRPDSRALGCHPHRTDGDRRA